MNYVLIGDVHGMLNPLEKLLEKLGFRKHEGVYQRENYQVIFLGDLVDRGVHQRGVIELVRGMVEQGHAHAIMGNHEHNMIGYYRRHSDTNEYLVKHKQYRTDMHQAFVNDYPEEQEESHEITAWLQTLPLYLDLPGLRAVHACWDARAIEALQPFLKGNNALTDQAFVDSFDKSSEVYAPVQRLIRGATVRLPRKAGVYDSFGRLHKNVRVKWWQSSYQSWDDLLTRQSDVDQAKAMPLPEGYLNDLYYDESEPPVFFGHYWFKGSPKPLARNIACLDYSACVGGQLVAYDWRADEFVNGVGLRSDRFVAVESESFLDQ